MRKNVLACLLAVGVLFLLGSSLSAAYLHTANKCGECHQPHRNFDPNDTPADYGVPLFDTQKFGGSDTGGVSFFDVYTSLWFDKYGVPAGQPTGASKLCLGCHDNAGGAGHKFKQADLKNSHPISVKYEDYIRTTNGQKNFWPVSTLVPLLGATATIATGMLDEKGMVQCVSCHDVHNTGTAIAALKFEAGSNRIVLCKTCHNK
jgi:hypothetical protein